MVCKCASCSRDWSNSDTSVIIPNVLGFTPEQYTDHIKTQAGRGFRYNG